MNIQRTENEEIVTYALQEPGDRIRTISFVLDIYGRGHRIHGTDGMVDGRIVNTPVGLLFEHWRNLVVENPCHLCAWEETLALLEKEEGDGQATISGQ